MYVALEAVPGFHGVVSYPVAISFVYSFFQFEKTADHLFDASFHGQKDAISGRQPVLVRACFVCTLCTYLWK